MTETLYCYVHPNRETSLRCNHCERPICADCAVLTPTGYRCKECVKGQQKVFDTSEWYDYVLGFITAGISFRHCVLPGDLDREYRLHWMAPYYCWRANRGNNNRGRCAFGNETPSLAPIVHYDYGRRCAGRAACYFVSIDQSSICLAFSFK